METCAHVAREPVLVESTRPHPGPTDSGENVRGQVVRNGVEMVERVDEREIVVRVHVLIRERRRCEWGCAAELWSSCNRRRASRLILSVKK